MKKNTIFDLDGTMVDSKRCIFTVYTRLFTELGVALPDDSEIDKFIGPPIEDMISERYSGDVATAAQRFREIYKTIDLIATNRVYDGIRELLERLQGRTNLYVGTTKNQYFAEKIINGFGLRKYFKGVYGSLSSEGRITKTDVLRKLLSDIGAEAEECILIGDTLYDVEGSENTGIPVAIVNYGFGKPTDFVDRKIEFFCDSAEEVFNKLEGIF